MRRREFIVLSGAAAVTPSAARAQQQEMPVVGYLHPGGPEGRAHLVDAFRKGLGDTGYIEGRNVVIDYRWARSDPKQIARFAAEFVRRKVAVIVTPIGTAAALAAKSATSTIPIVFSIGTDAVKAGLIASYNRPGGNLTGVGGMATELGAKRLDLLLELLPQARRVAVLVNPNNPLAAETSVGDVRNAAAGKGIDIDVVNVRNADEIGAAFATLAGKKTDGLIVGADPLIGTHRALLAALSARYALPTVYPLRDFAVAGGLMSYGPDDAARYRLVGVYVGRILKGEKPVDMPVQQPTKFELVINLKAAKALALEVPDALLARADEVIE